MRRKRVTALVLTAAFVFAAVFTSDAKTYITDESQRSGSDYTSDKAMAKKLDKIFAGDIDIYSSSSCVSESKFPLGKRLPGGTMYHVQDKIDGDVMGGWQCYIYANAVYNKLFHETPEKGQNLFHSEITIKGGSSTASYQMFKKAGVKCGAYFRSTVSSSGNYSSSGGHSLIILSYDKKGISYIEGNGDGNGLVRVAEKTWSEFNSSMLSGKGRYICHVIQPKKDCYETLSKTTVKALPSATLKSAKGKSRKIVVEWKRLKEPVTGYKIQYSLDSNFKKNKTKTIRIRNPKSSNTTILGLKAKKTYYVRVQSVRTITIGEKEKLQHSAWTTAVKVKTKK